MQLELDLSNGDHEKCAWCRKRFVWLSNAFIRIKALDGRYYCNETHASAQYLKVTQ